jgi:hypothetical protein
MVQFPSFSPVCEFERRSTQVPEKLTLAVIKNNLWHALQKADPSLCVLVNLRSQPSQIQGFSVPDLCVSSSLVRTGLPFDRLTVTNRRKAIGAQSTKGDLCQTSE